MSVHRIKVGETNCYLLRGPGGTILIDPGPPRSAEKVPAAAEEAGIGPQEISLILISHGHLDHYGAAPQVKAWCGAPVGAFRTEPAFSQERRNALPPAQTLRGGLFRWAFLLLSPLARHEALDADLLLDDGADLSAYGVDARAVLIPGHSPGSLAVLTAERDAFVGDLFVNYTLPSKPLYLSDQTLWEESCQRIRSFDPRTVYVGHGEPFAGELLGAIHPARYQLRWWLR